jgi:predicted dehydrogenase
MSEPVRWGLLSTARINDALVPQLQESPESELVAVASRSRERADAYAQERGIPRAYGGYAALLADPDVEVIYVSVPNGQHVEWSVASLEAGKHVLCEKPFARRPDDAARAFDVADSRGLLLMEAFMWRHHPQTARLVELVEGGAIGELRVVRAHFSFQIEDGNIRLDPALDGGALMDVGAYCVSAARLLAGEPERVSAQQVTGGSGVDTRLAATLVFPGDVIAQLVCAFDLPYRQLLEVVGSDASLHLDWPWSVRSPGIDLRRPDGSSERIEIEDVSSYRRQVDNFSRAVRGLEGPRLGRADALGQARTIDALYRSAAAGGEPQRLG